MAHYKKLGFIARNIRKGFGFDAPDDGAYYAVFDSEIYLVSPYKRSVSNELILSLHEENAVINFVPFKPNKILDQDFKKRAIVINAKDSSKDFNQFCSLFSSLVEREYYWMVRVISTDGFMLISEKTDCLIRGLK